MASRDYKVFVRSAFEPLAIAADRSDLLEKLRTENVSPDRQEVQYSRFNSFKVDQSDVVYLPNGGFVSLYYNGDERFIGVSSAGLISQDEENIIQWALDRRLEQDEFDESTFLCFVHYLKGYYRLADRFRAPEEALDVIDVVGVSYLGHSFSDLISYYRPVFVFRIPEDSEYRSVDIFRIAAELCCENVALRSGVVDQELAKVLGLLVTRPSVPNENIFQAITSSHSRHIFLELYRCLESIFYLPWMLQLKTAGGMQTRACDLKETCRFTLQWREKEKPSMERIFGLLPGSQELDRLEDAIDLFKDLKNADGFTRSQLGDRTYTIRNGLVHHEDYEKPNQYKPNDVQWRHLALYLATALLTITGTYERDLTPAQK